MPARSLGPSSSSIDSARRSGVGEGDGSHWKAHAGDRQTQRQQLAAFNPRASMAQQAVERSGGVREGALYDPSLVISEGASI
ncbi:hypothetical protein NDU88_011496 [Pleurodeles waltl]|uniref:Uncharacterized protein n=1 Tax=Pleurodeles waltl TaxID=8319 RepID=A0AAV7R3I5_PLEWA|nr:hypothetical protein NDU88_011496 [Pleurodeles waltl]